MARFTVMNFLYLFIYLEFEGEEEEEEEKEKNEARQSELDFTTKYSGLEKYLQN